MPITNKGHIINLELIVVILLSFTALFHFSPTFNTLSLYAIIPFLTILSFVLYKRIFVNAYLALYFLLVAWLACTQLWADDKELAFDEVKASIGVGMFSYIVTIWAQKGNILKWIYVVYIFLFIATIHYAYTEILPNIVPGEDRLTDEEMNANLLAYYSYYFMVITFILGVIWDYSIVRKAFNICAWLSIGLSLVIAILTASRQVMIIQVPLYILFIYIRYFKANETKRVRSLIIIGSIIVLYFLWMRYASILSNNLLINRLMDGGSDVERFSLMQAAYNIGWQHPFTGIGAGNFVINNPYFLFSHNSYLELWANSGIIGVLLFSCMLLLFVLRQIRYYRNTRNILFLFFLWFGLFFMIYQMIYVFYHNMWLIGFFMLIAAHSEKLYREELEKGGEQ